MFLALQTYCFTCNCFKDFVCLPGKQETSTTLCEFWQSLDCSRPTCAIVAYHVNPVYCRIISSAALLKPLLKSSFISSTVQNRFLKKISTLKKSCLSRTQSINLLLRKMTVWPACVEIGFNLCVVTTSWRPTT